MHPGADPNVIKLAVGAGLVPAQGRPQGSPLRIAANGDIVIPTDAGEVRLGKPLVFQEQSTVHSQQPTVAKDKGRKTNDVLSSSFSIQNSEFVQGSYALTAENQIAFSVPNYDRAQTLVVDPKLTFISTFGATNTTEGKAIAVDSAGNAYVTGYAEGTGFPTTAGSFQPTAPSGGAVLWKVDPSGAIVYATYLAGSSGGDQGFGIAVDSSGDAYVAGETFSTDFPVLNAFQPTLAGASDAFVTELNATGSGLVYSSYLGGAANAVWGSQLGYGIAVDSTGSAFVTGDTASSDFPTLNAFQPTLAGGNCGTSSSPAPCSTAFVTKVSPGGSTLVYSTFLGGSAGYNAGYAVAVDAVGDAFVGGFTSSPDFPALNALQSTCTPNSASPTGECDNAFVSELAPGGSALIFSTYLGGSCSVDVQGIALDPAGDIYVTGYTCSTDLPTANAFQPSNASTATPPDNAFLTEFTPGGAALVYSTYLGGSGLDGARAVAVDSLGEAFITGITSSTNFPLLNPLQATYGSASDDAFVTGFQAGGKGLIYSTYLGGSNQSVTYGYGIAVDAQGDAWVTGASDATTFVAAVSRPEVVHRYVPPRPLATSAVTAALAGSIALDMARVHAAPASLDFGAEVAGKSSAPETVTISNPGTAPLTFSAITASDSFAVPSGGSCSTFSPVAPGGSCTVDVAFAPTVGGNLTGTLTLTDNGIGSPHSVPLSGTGEDFALSTSQNSATVAAGGTATFTLSIASQGGFNHSLDLSCTDPASLSTCTVNPTSVTPSGSAGSTAVVSITTTAPSQVAPRGPSPGRPRGAPLLALAMLALLAVGAMRWHGRPGHGFIPRAGRPCHVAAHGPSADGRPLPLRLLALGLLLVLAWAACGGGGQPGTPAGTYTVTLKAADTQANLSHSTTLTLTVQ